MDDKPCGCNEDEWCGFCRPYTGCAKCAKQQAEIDRLRHELSEKSGQLADCHRLLREACEAICSELQPSMAYDRFMLRREWRVEAMQEAMKVGGDDD